MMFRQMRGKPFPFHLGAGDAHRMACIGQADGQLGKVAC